MNPAGVAAPAPQHPQLLSPGLPLPLGHSDTKSRIPAHAEAKAQPGTSATDGFTLMHLKPPQVHRGAGRAPQAPEQLDPSPKPSLCPRHMLPFPKEPFHPFFYAAHFLQRQIGAGCEKGNQYFTFLLLHFNPGVWHLAEHCPSLPRKTSGASGYLSSESLVQKRTESG